MDNINKIAILRALQLGDMLCMIPAVRAIKKAYPQAEITLLGLPGKENFVQRFNHYFSRLLPFPGWPGLPEQEADPAGIARFLLDAQQEQFDLVLQMQGSGAHTNDCCFLLNGRITAGLRAAGVWAPNETLFPLMTESEHEILRLLKIVHALDIPIDGTALEFPIHAEEYAGAGMIMELLNLQAGNYICLHPGARDPRRRWSAAHFAAVGDALAAMGHTIVVTGAAEEAALTQAVTAQMQYPAIDLVAQAGQTTIGEMAALIQSSQLLLSNDTGVSHIAAALCIPSVIIFSDYSDPGRWAPLNDQLHTVVTAAQANNLAYVADKCVGKINVNSLKV
ncbi:glycosyltransferase family 9 protein [uncultured Chitinophaga sp.]|jgi:ADP-heptose:LPS heptosyltransferase|uniref:glycosyltransferase family 9 protein n=1 Tax=uncultured Chitinophaga sp. TaxID=339340 RepID=UPI002612B8F9|nr:glycosyltransferase family 9 protein [uncultured Chitinophaga sp.]